MQRGAMSVSAQPRIRLLVVDDHPMMRDGIASAVRAQRDMEVIGEASDGPEAIEKFLALRPAVTLLDLNMPEMSGLETLTRIRQELPDARVVVLTTYKGDVLASRALKAGALGYLLKSSLRTDMLAAIRAANEGRRYVPAEVAMALAEHVGMRGPQPERSRDPPSRRGRAKQKEIANELGVSDETIKTHLKSTFSKLNVNDRSHAISTAMERGIFEL